MALMWILSSTLLSGIGSVGLAMLWRALHARGSSLRFDSGYLVSLAAGVLLAATLMQLLPEAFRTRLDPQLLFAILLAGLTFFFILQRAELRGSDETTAATLSSCVDARPGSELAQAGSVGRPERGRRVLLIKSGLRSVGNGLLLAPAFVADVRIGMAAALAILAREVSEHVAVLGMHRFCWTQRRAALQLSTAGLMAVLGGLSGWLTVDALWPLLPYFLVVVGSRFVYVALTNLVPRLHHRMSARSTVFQVFWLLMGILLVAVLTWLPE